MSSRCASETCGAEVRWVTTEAGKRMPIDPEPVEGGNVLMVAGGDGAVARVLSPAAAARTAGVLYRAHFTTCPDAEKWRRQQAGAGQ